MMKLTIRIIVLFVICPLFLFAGCQAYYWGRNAQSELILAPDTNIALTAEYLYYQPIPTLESISVFIKRETWSDMCVDTSDYVLNYILFSGVSWFVNNSRVPDELVTVFQNPLTLEGTKDLGTCLLFPVWDTLNPGFHLFEIRLQNSPFDTGRSYQWAIKIEPTGIPTPSATPSAP